ncbi:hypothetical protein FHS25_007017 [Rhizobium laguerreae]|uniref:Uncharacterized protein n=1 Tax=Rhizobium laguerreae TaxID=1076926 RepID=A0ABR6GJP2_9HYPH|nr:hypothetical protein [Rhizobium laguerreae]
MSSDQAAGASAFAAARSFSYRRGCYGVPEREYEKALKLPLRVKEFKQPA